ncbi:hypothetical protein FALBO_3114 [Fusarium albosuccineum]|uniref:Uncharacterized protein n=1 Tax=Fusarium albosuccineum TaxID=1237068 RepID=A0A8H4LJN0_9HYPO|nr:hypothetical protein FALBO_3114 [Fusarium albosuccineum]
MVTGSSRPKPGDKLFRAKSSSIPHLTSLRQELGYGNKGRPEDIAFKRAVRAHVEKFVSKDNIPATQFTKWKTPAHQRGLTELTKNFLHAQGKGLEFWPDDPNSPNKRPLEYTRDCAQIQRLMVKVFYRTIREHKRYTTSATNDLTQPLSHNIPTSSGPSALGRAQDPRGHSVDDPIDLESMQPPPNVPGQPIDNDPFTGMSFNFNQFALASDHNGTPDGLTPPQEGIPDLFDLSAHGATSQVSHNGRHETRIVSDTHTAVTEDGSGVDLYDVPNSPREATSGAQNRSKRPAEQPEPNEDSHRAKAPRQGQNNPEEQAHQSASGPATQKRKRGPRPPPGEKTRVLTRERRPPQRLDYAGEETTDDHILCSSSPSADEESGPQDRDQPRTNGASSRVEVPRANLPNPVPRSDARPAEQLTSRCTIHHPVQASTKKVPPSSRKSLASQAGTGTGNRLVRMPLASNASNMTAPADPLPLDSQQKAALEASKITYHYCINGLDTFPWQPPGNQSLFQMSLQSVATELQLKPGFQSLYLILKTPGGNLNNIVSSKDEAHFRDIKEEFLAQITEEYRRRLAVSPADGAGLRVRIHLQQQ